MPSLSTAKRFAGLAAAARPLVGDAAEAERRRLACLTPYERALCDGRYAAAYHHGAINAAARAAAAPPPAPAVHERRAAAATWDRARTANSAPTPDSEASSARTMVRLGGEN